MDNDKKSFFKKVNGKVYVIVGCIIVLVIVCLFVFNMNGSNDIIKCTFDGEMVQGAEFTKGAYTYHYMQDGNNKRWKNITSDGWGVKLSNTDVTEVSESPCTMINDKPVVSTSYMFANAYNLSKINIKNFNTSYITDMSNMFYLVGRDADNVSILNLGKFDTSNVTNMSSMFERVGFKSDKVVIDGIDKFNTSNVTDMSSMFSYAGFSATSVSIGDLSKFDMTNVKDINNMFSNFAYYAESLDIGDLNTWNIDNEEVVQDDAFMTMGVKSKYVVPTWYTGETEMKYEEDIDEISH